MILSIISIGSMKHFCHVELETNCLYTHPIYISLQKIICMSRFPEKKDKRILL